MPRLVAFLRAVNVGGRSVKMDALRAAFEAIGLTDVQTFIASGNVVFDSPARSLPALERKIEAQLQTAFGFEVDTFVRTLAEVAALAADTAFEADTVRTRTQVVGFLREVPGDEVHQTLQRMSSDVDRLRAQGRELFWHSSNSQADSTFSNAAFERALKLRTTFRGISTLRKLVDKHG
jgi:uncharacterized protein (DUF1697 family)